MKQRKESWLSYLTRIGIPSYECILWPNCTLHGYGIVRYEGKNMHAHRLSFLLHNPGVDISALQVNHHCDNPLCINHEHLYLGTQQENVDDMHRRGRAVYIRGEKIGSAKLNEQQVREIKSRLSGVETPNQIAESYGISGRTVRAIRNGEKWKHIA